MTIENLLEIMDRLRDPNGGCPWDLEQDFRTIAPHTVEEAYEVADAIEKDDMDSLKDELGDLLFQVVYHARLASEREAFRFDDVVTAICNKMVRRHPHVFGDEQIENAAAQSRAWEQQKHRERNQVKKKEGQQSALDGVPVGLPALPRAAKLGKRAAAVGFDWPDYNGVRNKIVEELAELDEVIAGGTDRDSLRHEFGDVLLAMANLGRHLDVDPEGALRAANLRFEKRFSLMEKSLQGQGCCLAKCSPEDLDTAWERAKQEA